MPNILRRSLAFACLTLGTAPLACADRTLAETTDAPASTTSATTDAPGEPTSSSPSTTTAPLDTTTTTAPPDPTTGSPGSTGGDDDSSGGETSSSFVTPSDGGIIEPGCDPWVQDCPEGQKCAAVSLDGDHAFEAVKCVPVVADPDDVGEPCDLLGTGFDGLDTCAKGQMCWGYDLETKLGGTCHAQCEGSPEDPTCPADQTCIVSADSVLNLCIPRCDPLTDDCPAGEVCVASPVGDAFVCALDFSGDEGQAFDPCEYINVCDPGLACLDAVFGSECAKDVAGCCLPYCDLGAPPACPGAGQECIPWFKQGQAPRDLEHVGVCGVPS